LTDKEFKGIREQMRRRKNSPGGVGSVWDTGRKNVAGMGKKKWVLTPNRSRPGHLWSEAEKREIKNQQVAWVGAKNRKRNAASTKNKKPISHPNPTTKQKKKEKKKRELGCSGIVVVRQKFQKAANSGPKTPPEPRMKKGREPLQRVNRR